MARILTFARLLLRHPHLRAALGVPQPPFQRPAVLPSFLRKGFALRPYRVEDEGEWGKARSGSEAWLRPWDSTDPLGGRPLSFPQWVRGLDWQALIGESVAFTIRTGGRFVGEISLGALCYGSMRTGIAGYWVSRNDAGRGFAPLALAVLCDWAFFHPTGPHLNRVEVDLLPSNTRSRRVVVKNGFTFQGVRPAWMHVDGQWHDHEVWDLLASDVLGVPRDDYRPGGPAAAAAAGRHPCERRLLEGESE